MKEHYAGTLAAGSDITDFFMVRSIGIKVGSNKKNYLDLMLGDSSGEINGKKWDVSDEEADALMDIAEGDIVKIKAQVTEWNGVRQLRVGRIRKAEARDGLNMADFVKAAPEDPNEMFSYVLERAGAIKDEALRKLAVNALEENKE